MKIIKRLTYGIWGSCLDQITLNEWGLHHLPSTTVLTVLLETKLEELLAMVETPEIGLK